MAPRTHGPRAQRLTTHLLKGAARFMAGRNNSAPYTCRACGVIFTVESELRLHIILRHRAVDDQRR